MMSHKKCHDNKVKVVVYILTSDPHSKRVHEIKNLFKDNIFLVKPVNIVPRMPLSKSKLININQALEVYRVMEVLLEAEKDYPDLNVLIIKDNSVANSSSEDVENIVKNVLKCGGWDLCYLCRWLDRCDLYSNVKQIKGKTSVLVKTLSPNGFQAIIFSKDGRDIVLGKRKMRDGTDFHPITKPIGSLLTEEIEKENIFAICVVPNLFEFDVLMAEDVSDLAKLSECRRPENNGKKINETFSYIWFLTIVIGVILLIGAFWYFGPRYKKKIS